MTTAIRAVIANQSRVRQTRRAAFCRSARLAMLATMAVNTSGGTRAFSSWMKLEPRIRRVSASAKPCSPSAGPRLRAMRPRMTPTTMAANTWTPKPLMNRDCF